METSPRKILLVGNIAGGKTRLSHRLAEIYSLPLIHVDSIQFLPGMKIRPLDETRKKLSEVTGQEQWIIDGHGPLDQIQSRFDAADRIVFVDLPVRVHFCWLTKRQIQSLWCRRPELPSGCSERNFTHTRKLYRTLWKIHRKMRPELLRIFARPELKRKVIRIQTVGELNEIARTGLPAVP